jgi:hypothetical protein
MAITATSGLAFLGAAGGGSLLALGYNTAVGRPEIGLLNAAVFGIEAVMVSEVTVRALGQLGDNVLNLIFQWMFCSLLAQYASQAIGYLPITFAHAGYLAVAGLVSYIVVLIFYKIVKEFLD